MRRLAIAAALVVVIVAALCAEPVANLLSPLPMPDFLRRQYWPIAALSGAFVACVDAVAILFVVRRVRAARSRRR